MQIRYVQCQLVRDAMMKIPKTLPAWELQMLKTVYGSGKIEDIEHIVVDDAPAPLPPEDELARLAKHYGREKRDDGSAGDNWAGIAYGRGDAGIREIERLMREAIVDLPAAAEGKATKGKAKKADAPEGDAEGGNGD